MKRGLKPESVRRKLVRFSDVFNKTIKRWGFPSLENPLIDTKFPKLAEPRERLFKGVEIEKLLWVMSYVEGQTPTNATQRVTVAFLFAIETAMCAGEIANFHKFDIDFDKRVALLRLTKNGKDRKVPLSPRAIELLRVLPESSDETIFDLTDKSGRSPGERIGYLFPKAKKKQLSATCIFMLLAIKRLPIWLQKWM